LQKAKNTSIYMAMQAHIITKCGLPKVRLELPIKS